MQNAINPGVQAEIPLRAGTSSPPLSGSREDSVRYVWYVIGLLAVVNVFNTMDRMALAVLAPLIKVDLQLSDSQLGLLLGFAFAIFYAICSIPIARWADRGNRRNIMSLALAVWSVMTALSGAAQNFWHLFLARVGMGAGEAGGVPPAQSVLCDYVPLERRSGVFAVHMFGLIAGLMLGLVLAGWLGDAIGWRWTFVALGLPGLVLALILRLTLREPVRGRFEAVKEQGPRLSLGETLSVLWRCRTYRLLSIFLALNGFVQYGLLQWWPSLYARVFGFSVSEVGFSLGLAFGAGSGAGVLFGGWLSNRAAKRDVRLPLQIGAATLVVALPAALVSLFVPSALWSLLLVSATQLCWGLLGGPAYATLYSVTRPQMRATAGAITLFATSLLGSGLGPFCVGVLSDWLTPSLGAEALRYALLAPVCLFPVLILLVYMAAKALPHDLPTGGESGSPATLHR